MGECVHFATNAWCQCCCLQSGCNQVDNGTGHQIMGDKRTGAGFQVMRCTQPHHSFAVLRPLSPRLYLLLSSLISVSSRSFCFRLLLVPLEKKKKNERKRRESTSGCLVCRLPTSRKLYFSRKMIIISSSTNPFTGPALRDKLLACLLPWLALAFCTQSYGASSPVRGLFSSPFLLRPFCAMFQRGQYKTSLPLDFPSIVCQNLFSVNECRTKVQNLTSRCSSRSCCHSLSSTVWSVTQNRPPFPTVMPLAWTSAPVACWPWSSQTRRFQTQWRKCRRTARKLLPLLLLVPEVDRLTMCCLIYRTWTRAAK